MTPATLRLWVLAPFRKFFFEALRLNFLRRAMLALLCTDPFGVSQNSYTKKVTVLDAPVGALSARWALLC